MTHKKMKAHAGILVLIVFVVALSRLLPYVLGIQETFNFSPLAAIALFGGAYFAQRSSALVFPLLALWLSNLLLDNLFLSQYYEGFVFFANWEVYLAIAAVVGLAMLVLKKVTVTRVIGASLLASLTFFVLTNFVVWASSGLYAKTFSGLVECYTMAIPFFRNTLLGDLVFTAVLFGAFEWAGQKFQALERKLA